MPTVMIPETDYYLYLSWIFVVLCTLGYFTKSPFCQNIIETIRNNWREAEIQHEHIDWLFFDSYENEISWLELFIQNKVTLNQFVTDIQNIFRLNLDLVMNTTNRKIDTQIATDLIFASINRHSKYFTCF